MLWPCDLNQLFEEPNTIISKNCLEQLLGVEILDSFPYWTDGLTILWLAFFTYISHTQYVGYTSVTFLMST